MPPPLANNAAEHRIQYEDVFQSDLRSLKGEISHNTLWKEVASRIIDEYHSLGEISRVAELCLKRLKEGTESLDTWPEPFVYSIYNCITEWTPEEEDSKTSCVRNLVERACAMDHHPIPMDHFIEIKEAEKFRWSIESQSEDQLDWRKAADVAGLPPERHKIFPHNHKRYFISRVMPFVKRGELGVSGTTSVHAVVAPPRLYGVFRQILALKVIECPNPRRGPDRREREEVLNEIRLMRQNQHRHIVVYVASFEDSCYTDGPFSKRRPTPGYHSNHRIGIAMYPAGKYNLKQYMHEIPILNEEETSIRVKALHGFFGCLSQALTYIHNKEHYVKHKDIKPENILVDHFHQPILTDFGLSVQYDRESETQSDGKTRQTKRYAPPEADEGIPREWRYDVFSMGCVFLEMVAVLLGDRSTSARDEDESDTEESMGRDEDSPEDFLSSTVEDRQVESFQYSKSHSLERLDSYISKLRAAASFRTDSQQAVVYVLDTIREMMQKDHRDRPRARDLYPKFAVLYGVYGNYCTGCQQDHANGAA
ncbi:hypothetical protein PG990_007576 [Apiospora arundinis]